MAMSKAMMATLLCVVLVLSVMTTTVVGGYHEDGKGMHYYKGDGGGVHELGRGCWVCRLLVVVVVLSPVLVVDQIVVPRGAGGGSPMLVSFGEAGGRVPRLVQAAN